MTLLFIGVKIDSEVDYFEVKGGLGVDNAKERANKKYEERRELVDIYNELTPSVKEQLLTTARIILNTQNIVLNDRLKKKYIKK